MHRFYLRGALFQNSFQLYLYIFFVSNTHLLLYPKGQVQYVEQQMWYRLVTQTHAYKIICDLNWFNLAAWHPVCVRSEAFDRKGALGQG